MNLAPFWVSLLSLCGAAMPADLPVDRLPRPLFQGVPDGLAAIPYPPENPYSEERIELGRRLFFDPLLSIDRSVSCAACHRPDHGFSAPEARSPGVRGQLARRHAPTLINRAFGRYQRWDGRAQSLEEQVLLPIVDPIEMGLSLGELEQRLRDSEAYRAGFAAAFPGRAEPLDRDTIALTLAAFVRHLVSGDSPIDRFRAGQHGALTPSERTGLWLYESKAKCWQCHAGPNFTDEDFHNTGVAVVAGEAEPGRFAVTGQEVDRGRFKTPTLRGVALRAPYMHDGSLETLRDVVEFYRRGGNSNANLDERLKPLELSDADVDHLVAFLEALSRAAPMPGE